MLDKSRSVKATVLIASSLLSFSLLAENTKSKKSEPEAIEELLVSGKKIPKKANELTHSVTLVNEIEIENQGFTDVTEILRQQVGIEFKQSGGVGQFNYMKMRGLKANNILIVLDGVKINKASSGDTGNLLSQLDPTTIESIEVLRGPQASLYGANSSAGVLVIKTKSGDKATASIGVEAGSMKWRKVKGALRNSSQLGENFGSGTLNYALNASKTDSENTHEHEFFEDTSIQFKTSYELDNLTFGLQVYDVDNAFNAAELIEVSDFLSSRAQHWAFQVGDPDNTSSTTQTVYSAFVEQSFNDELAHKFQMSRSKNTYTRLDLDNGFLGTVIAPVDGVVVGSVAGDTLYVYDRRWPYIFSAPQNSSATAVEASYKDFTRQYEYNLVYTGNFADLLVGGEYIRQQALQFGSYGATDNYDSQKSVYINGSLKLLAEDALVLSAGARLDSYKTWGVEKTGNLGFSWQLTDNTRVYSNYGTSFKPATMRELFNPTYGDQALKPESGETREVGISQTALNKRLTMEVTYWDTDIDNVIFYDRNRRRVNGGLGRYNNGQKLRSSGVELQTSLQLSDSFLLYANYTYTDSHGKAVGSNNWKRTVQIARNKGNLGFRHDNGRWAYGLNTYYAAPRLRWKGDVEMKEYVRVDLSTRYQASNALSVSLRVENLFDEDIEEGLGYEEPGIYAIAGVEYKLF